MWDCGHTFAGDVPPVGELPGPLLDALATGGVSAGAQLASPLPDHVQERLLVLETPRRQGSVTVTSDTDQNVGGGMYDEEEL